MRREVRKGFAFFIAVILFAAIFSGCKESVPSENTAETTTTKATAQVEDTVTEQPEQSSTFIADRQIKGRIFLEGDGSQLPSDQINNEVAVRIKELTGITLEWQSTGANDGLQELTLALASGDLPEVMVNYLDHGGRPEMAVMLKAAREDMYTDIKPYLTDTEVLKNYLEPGFLPMDTRDNIMFRPEFDGKCYFVHMQIPSADIREDEKMNGRGGLYMKEDIINALGLDTTTIKTQDDFYNLLVEIKEGNFKDANGKDVIPLGTRIFGGSLCNYIVRNYDFGNGTGFDIDSDGKVKHVAETDYVFEQIKFVQKLLNEKLIDPEFFTMDGTRALENVVNGTYAITGYANENRTQFRTISYLPFYLNNYKGEENTYYVKEKEGYLAWSIPNGTENPQEIVKFADFLSTKEGKALWNYGVEGETYEVLDGKYIFSSEYLTIQNEDPEEAKELVPYFWGKLLGNTNLNNMRDFGEIIRGSNSEPEKWAWKFKILNYNTPNFVYWDGYSAASYLSELPDLQATLQPVLDNYSDIMIQAFYADSFEEAKNIIMNYRTVLKQAGIEEFESYLEEKNTNEPGTVVFYMHATY